MSAVQPATIVLVTIDGVEHTATMRHWQHGIGARPSEAVVNLVLETGRTFNFRGVRGQPAVIRFNGAPILTGHVHDTTGTLSDDSVLLRILDNRWLINRDWVGRRHRGADGLPVLGADIIFNLDGKPNKDADARQFVYEKGNPEDEEDCEVEEAVMWTYRDIVLWLFDNYINDVQLRSELIVPNTDGMEREADEIGLLGRPVAEALDFVMSHTRVTWTMLGDGSLIFFSRPNPVTQTTMRFPDQLAPISNADYNTDIPVEFQVNANQSNIITNLTVLGGKEIREIEAGSDDFLDPVESKFIKPVPSAPINMGGTPILINWHNYSKGENYLHRFNKARYEAHNLGKNIRRKDPAKPCLAELLLKRDKEGNYVSPDSECGLYGVGTEESLGPQYVDGGVLVDLDRAEIRTDKLETGEGNGDETPERWIAAMESEVRKYVEAVAQNDPGDRGPGRLPASRDDNGAPEPAATVHRAVVRPEFVHKSREEVHVPVPVDLLWFIDPVNNAHNFTETPLVEIPPEGTLDFMQIGAGQITPPTNLPTFKPTFTMPEGVVVDGVTPLQEIADLVEPELGRISSEINGSLPTFVNLAAGTRILTNPELAFGSINDEVVIALSFDGQSQRLDFIATNQIGPDVTGLANTFLDQRRFRIRRR